MTMQKRSENRGEQADLFAPLLPSAGSRPRLGASPPPPGARQGALPPARAGGGSRPICTGSGAAVGQSAPARAAPPPPLSPGDPRLDELRQLGLSHVWLRVAEAIGFDAWVHAWEAMATDDSVLADRNRVYVPPLQSYLRYQRNLLIRSMAESGFSVEQIRQRLRADFRENLSRKRLHRLIESMRN